MLSKRYEDDGRPTYALNELQLVTKRQIGEKIKQGIYRFESVPCCICQRSDFELLSRKDRYGLYMPVVICRYCGLIQTNPRMNQDSYSQFYRQEYRKLYNGVEIPTEGFFAVEYKRGRAIYDYLIRKNILPGLSLRPFVLEVGCSAGGILHYFREKGCRVKGVDLDEEYVQYGRERHHLDLSVGTIHDVALCDTPDIIIYADVLEHILSPSSELIRVRQILSGQGVLYVELPGVKNLFPFYRDFIRLLQNAHTFHFSLATLVNLLELHGFRLVAGDEAIRSVFQKAEPSAHTVEIKNDYVSAMCYLKRWEKLRMFFPFPPGEFNQLPKVVTLNVLVKLLKLTRLYNFVAGIYHRLKSRGKPL